DPGTASPAPFPITVIPAIAARLTRGEVCWFSTLHELPESDHAAFSHLGVRSAIVLPVARPDDGDGAATALALGSLTREQRGPPALVESLPLLRRDVRQAARPPRSPRACAGGPPPAAPHIVRCSARSKMSGSCAIGRQRITNFGAK